MYMRPENWIEILEKEYLQNFICSGGSAVKFALLLENISPDTISTALMKASARNNYVFASVEAGECKLHMIEHLFFAIARQIDWDRLSRDFLKKLLVQNGYRHPDSSEADAPDSLSLDILARLNNRVPNEFRRDINIWLEKVIYDRTDIALEFRIAMIRLCVSQLEFGSSALSQHLHDSIILWLTGELRRITDLRSALIYQKINRNNARSMVLSLPVFLKMSGFNGMVIHLDISRYLLTRRPAEPDGKNYYTKAAAMDLFEVLRQFIDGTDRQQHSLTVISAPLDLLQDDKRGIGIYTALRDRIVDDVRDRTRANPMASLVRLAYCGEPVSLQQSEYCITCASAVQYQRAIEALRCGVPNEDAVREMTSFQPHIHNRFQLQLGQLKENPQEQSPGMLIAGGFGGGKSHLLQYLQHEALKQNFICSKIAISKETPLFDPCKLYSAAIKNLRLPGNHNSGMDTIAHRLEPNSDRLNTMLNWLKDPHREIPDQFAATLLLYMQFTTDPEFLDRVIRYWSGDKLVDSDIKRRLRQLGELQSFQLDRIKNQDLAMEQFRFAAQLMIAAGYHGWVLLLDEAELMGRYSLLQRSRSYGQMARLLGRVADWRFEGMTTVIAITDDFQSAILDDKNDIEKVPNRLLARGSESDLYLAKIAEHCMQIIQKDRVVLRQPDDDVIERTFRQLEDVYGKAYQWAPAAIARGERLSSSRMRHFVKSWITEWDLKRFYPEHAVDITTDAFAADYSEDKDLEIASESDNETEEDYR